MSTTKRDRVLPRPDAPALVALLLGVVSVVDSPAAVLGEARRVTRRLGVLDYCSTTGATLSTGGSHFLTVDDLAASVRDAGWTVAQTSDVTMPAPQRWTDASDALDVTPEASEMAVRQAIERGDLLPHVLVAER